MRITLMSVLLLCFGFGEMRLHGQHTLDDIDLESIQHKSIRKYVERQIEEGRQQFDDIQPSWTKGDDLSLFNKDEMFFSIDASLQMVWQSYLSIDPSKLWNHRRTSKGLMLQKSPVKIFYDSDSLATTDIGQVYFLDLKLLAGLYHVATAFEIVSIDVEDKVIEFSYIKGNRSLGVQQIKFLADGPSTEIVHTSYFKSDSRIRDKWLYPFFHKKLTRDFHENVRRLLMAIMPSMSMVGDVNH